nr:GNAT family N-acetyltransferase [Tissierella sp.]
MDFRKSKKEDVEHIMIIIKKAQEYLKSQGINQWQNGYPDEAAIEKDIDDGISYVLLDGEKIVGTTAFSFDGESTYEKVHDGNWLSDEEYGVIHRMAVDLDSGRRGIAGEILKHSEDLCSKRDVRSIKVDTHRDNMAMQNFLKKNGFIFCGIIYLKDKTERLAFEKVL